ncbi:hypothetical protein RFI_20322 [Reticulomyxa filosa]|uniref:IBR domain-containing protein n=1 Tax=Reticulomyxa filosa TaxID=46433 RepID=X6MV89_RETFI|nr:hypothetical protein RFI_20322 [Reticulomyxa filosa]|eukprot:ETO17020.1 hypothetical protein RFI_20322 [Reticulomyxa filosa]
MPCGHAIGCYTMFEYMKSVLNRDMYSYKILCPAVIEDKIKTTYTICGKEWDWQLVAAVADLNENEYTQYTDIITNRFMEAKEIKTCPSCLGKCIRGKYLNVFRTKCLGCNSDFCWACEQPWQSEGQQICGNQNCPLWETQKLLETCDLKVSSDVKMPPFRACPACLSVPMYFFAIFILLFFFFAK